MSNDTGRDARVEANLDEIGWLIEKADTSAGVLYLRTHEPEWTPDANKALRFYRKADAEDFSNFVYDVEEINVIEHMWVSTPPAQPVADVLTPGEREALELARDFVSDKCALVRSDGRRSSAGKVVDAINAIIDRLAPKEAR